MSRSRQQQLTTALVWLHRSDTDRLKIEDPNPNCSDRVGLVEHEFGNLNPTTIEFGHENFKNTTHFTFPLHPITARVLN